MELKKVWYVTGASKGLGLALVKKLLGEGYRVAATSRSKDNLATAVGSFDSEKFLPLAVNLLDQHSITQSIKETTDFFGRLDVIVNNAGYGIGGAVEELNEQEIRQSFDVNVFAVIKVMQAAMPYLRSQRSGHIINISSIAGFAAASGWAMYAATKYAVMGLTEVMAEDLRELGINVTAVAPGAFRTEFLDKNSLVFAANKINDYQGIRASHEKYQAMHNQQLGDPNKAAEIFIALAENEHPPIRLYLGGDAYSRAKAKIKLLEDELEANKSESFYTDFDKS